ncbi:hypothetical protein A3F08_01230 [Candidatus Berkelbacteria bacterium RIFCSPHIGHO2_12_FULL_36_9]|uniref:Uncharacterized protein n=1 Tax=Candidatus Berkelbacteria bacterium RIFCSPHIGHO2_12_FULL_36_9 TaxID=1797469 RepID=A0A1F5EK44_9BACT|nr:MAG: hypothetical protein A3F08_01230 [Candidatus Berkelbacteria bacterium RIFCSPHIGHO2_12_FULL_36_9]
MREIERIVLVFDGKPQDAKSETEKVVTRCRSQHPGYNIVKTMYKFLPAMHGTRSAHHISILQILKDTNVLDSTPEVA